MYVNWHKQPVASFRGDTYDVEGPFISGETVSIGSSAQSSVAPDGAYYATVWSDAAAYVDHSSNPTATATDRAIPAGMMVQVAFGEVVPGKTKIAGLEI
jgi:hypothetical protein